MAVIYGLFDPRRPLHLWEVRYIGQTTMHPEERLSAQIGEATRSTPRRPVGKWLRKLTAAGIRPTVVALEADDDSEIDAREIAWIAEGRRQGWRLLNVVDGGRGIRGYRHTEETKAQISASLTGRKLPPRSDEWRRKISEAKRGKKQSPETVAKRAASRIGSKHSPETRAKIAEANRRRVVTDETKAKMSASKRGVPNPKAAEALRGRTLTEEHRLRISEGVRANLPAGDAKERVREAARQRPSEATKQKMAAARQAWWERKRQSEDSINRPG